MHAKNKAHKHKGKNPAGGGVMEELLELKENEDTEKGDESTEDAKNKKQKAHAAWLHKAYLKVDKSLKASIKAKDDAKVQAIHLEKMHAKIEAHKHKGKNPAGGGVMEELLSGAMLELKEKEETVETEETETSEKNEDTEKGDESTEDAKNKKQKAHEAWLHKAYLKVDKDLKASIKAKDDARRKHHHHHHHHHHQRHVAGPVSDLEKL